MDPVCTFGSLMLFWMQLKRIGHVDAFDHQDFIFRFDLPDCGGGKAPFACRDSARFQRAA
jgi:hypothetical protein